MSSPLLTYKQLAEALGLAPGTVKNNWRSYPHVAVTPSAQQHPNLRGVRFILEDVLEDLRRKTRQGADDGSSPIQRSGRKVPGLFQVAGEAIQQNCEHQSRRQSMGGRNEKIVGEPGTVREKFMHLSEFASFMVEKYGGGDFPAAGVTVAHGKAFVASMREAHNNKSANRRLRTLKAMWTWCREELPNNPFRSIPMYPEDAFTKYVPPPEDVEKVVEQAAAWEQRLLTFLLCTGARVGEMFQLTWADVNFERNTLLLWTRKRKGGNRQPRLMPLAPRLRLILEQLAKGREDSKEHVFINPTTGGPYTKLQPSVRYMLRRLCKAAGVREFGFHALRHYVAARLAQSQQANLVEIQQFLGHQRTTTTDLYLRSMSSASAIWRPSSKPSCRSRKKENNHGY